MKPIRTSALKQRRVLAVVEIGAGDIDFKGVAIKCLKPSCLKLHFPDETDISCGGNMLLL
jgi:hypothetical protein